MNMRCIFLLASLALIGCQDRFRYPCQDPANWEKTECKRPICSSTGTCPDQLTKPEDMKSDEPAKTDKPIPCNEPGAARCSN
jgi:hypothetical protein